MKNLVIGVAASLIVASGSAMAADLAIDDQAMAMASQWDGAYAGLGGIVYSSTTIAETGAGIAGILGVNKTVNDKFLLGGEVYAGGTVSSLGGPAYYVLGAEGRGGYLVSDNTLLYGAAGVELEGGGNAFGTRGGGVEFAATEQLSIDIEYKYFIGLNNSWGGHQVGASLNWHF